MMNKNKIGLLSAFAMMSAMSKPEEHVIIYDDKFSSSVDPEKLKEGKVIPPIPEVIPAGCKEYFFNAAGEFSTTKMRKDETVFICYAINDRNAIKKFNKFNSSPYRREQ